MDRSWHCVDKIYLMPYVQEERGGMFENTGDWREYFAELETDYGMLKEDGL